MSISRKKSRSPRKRARSQTRKKTSRTKSPRRGGSFHRVRISAAAHSHIEQLVEENIEYGGALVPGSSNKYVLTYKRVQAGKKSAVRVPHSAVQFHTHPPACKRSKCKMGVPSPEDIVDFLAAVRRRQTQIHCVYASEGTYCMRAASSAFAHPLPRRVVLSELKAFRADETARFAPFTPAMYKKHRRRWAAFVRLYGVLICFFPKKVPPSGLVVSSSV